MFYDYLKLCRPAHAVKNLLVLLPPFFGHRLLESQTLKAAPWAFIAFSMIASAIYVINDMADAENDRMNPAKKNRPIASGRVSMRGAAILLVLLIAGGFAMLCLAHDMILTSVLLVVYFALNIGYSLKLKNQPVVDVFILASGFVLRIYFGGAWFGVVISPWLFLCILCGALCFALGKRRNEMLHINAPHLSRPVLSKYTQIYLTNSYYMFCGMTIVFFSLWTVFATNQKTMFLFTIPLVILIILRYNLIIETTDTAGDPIPTLLNDKALILFSVIFAALSFAGVYFV